MNPPNMNFNNNIISPEYKNDFENQNQIKNKQEIDKNFKNIINNINVNYNENKDKDNNNKQQVN